MKRITILFLLLATCSAFAQKEYAEILSLVEQNNLTLKDLRLQTDANKLENTNTLENPEFEFGYLWGKPQSIGNRTDFSISQTFDFPTLYLQRSKAINLENQSLDLQYSSQRLNILLETQKICTELVFHNAVIELYSNKLDIAKDLLEAYRKKMSNGDANILEVNKVELNMVSLQSLLNEAVLHRNVLLSELAKLNGGQSITFTTKSFAQTCLPADFETWYKNIEQKIPELQIAENNLSLNKQQLTVAKNEWLPQISAGYMSENVVGEKYQGFTIGMSLPLWSNAKKVRQKNLQVKASETQLQSYKTLYYNELKKLYNKAIALQQTSTEMEKILNNCNSEQLLKKAFDAGEISLLDYILEMDFYKDAAIKLLETQRDAKLACIDFYATEL